MSAVVTGLPTPTPVELPLGFELHSNVFWLSSPKNKRKMKFFSELEYQHALLLEGTPEAVEYCEQPIKLELKDRRYVFDCWIRWSSGLCELREVKPTSKLVNTESGERLPPRWAEISAWCQRNGFLINFVTEKDLKPEMQFIRNWQRLNPYVLTAREDPRPDIEKSILQIVADAPRITIAQVWRNLSELEPTIVTASIADLLHRGTLTADLHGLRFGPGLWLTRNLGHART